MIAFRYGGKGSESDLYINPRFEPHLKRLIKTYHEAFQANRTKNHDPNGFQNKKARNLKFFDYLNELSKNTTSPHHWFAKRMVDYINRLNTENRRSALIALTKIRETYRISPHAQGG